MSSILSELSTIADAATRVDCVIIGTKEQCYLKGKNSEDILITVATILAEVKNELGQRALKAILSGTLAACTEEEQRDVHKMVADLIQGAPSGKTF